jgi:hypothetical protein
MGSIFLIALGAVLMYSFDPVSGKSRRAMVCDKMGLGANKQAADTTSTSTSDTVTPAPESSSTTSTTTDTSK